jgi:hypothetical protein
MRRKLALNVETEKLAMAADVVAFYRGFIGEKKTKHFNNDVVYKSFKKPQILQQILLRWRQEALQT